ncbi:putative membrane protein [Campylobacter blaseri]|uniref:Uncharacterized protein n=1 Tax=Campylobacter blaseri TaxID=2042961 RepID=A0A2P8QYT5_9BACT|nr:hypothetical protein [Campylobacter blaseri]PSM51410.1 hypothetical protein CQ405_08455 [Campylobacter blaseri]PSM52860.1 hypothetical protein CRN67_08460 [Campylobacter blaseri]QKF86163.1 putative membrane protein [Campylobacter blaseri]
MDNLPIVLNALRDPAGVPFYPVVFQGLYILTWALHIAFVLLALGGMGLSLFGQTKKNASENWNLLTSHMVQISKVSVSVLIVLGVAPLLFTQVIYDPNWYVTNTLSGLWVAAFIYIMVFGYSIWYWFASANKKDSKNALFIGAVAFALMVFGGILMHAFAYESIQPEQWMNWYAPNGIIDDSGTILKIDIVRLAFMVSLAVPVLGIFLLNYRDYMSKKEGMKSDYLEFVGNMGKKLGVVGFLISAVLFVVWMLKEGLLFNPLSLAIVVCVLVLLYMIIGVKNSYYTTIVLVVAALLISGLREYIRYSIMIDLDYNIYNYTVNTDWPSVIMFLLTFVFVGFSGVIFLLTLAWKAGRKQGLYESDAVDHKLGNITIGITITWMVVFLAWGLYIVFKNSL